MTDLVDRVRGWRQRLETTRDDAEDKFLRRTLSREVVLLKETEEELIRLQLQENWALHLEGEVCALKEKLGVLS